MRNIKKKKLQKFKNFKKNLCFKQLFNNYISTTNNNLLIINNILDNIKHSMTVLPRKSAIFILFLICITFYYVSYIYELK